MKAVEVTARFTPEGEIIPLEFRVHSSSFRVQTTGRRWTTEQGIHILVLDSTSRSHHLLYMPGQQVWYRIQDLEPPARPV
jgi:hypothetical protein